MEKPIIYYNNRLLDAKKGDDGTSYAAISSAVRHPGNDNAMLCSPTLISDLAADYTALVGMQVKMTSTENRYNVLAQADSISVMPASRYWCSIAKNGTTHVAIAGRGGATDKCATSTDGGISWVERTLPASRTWSAVVWTGTYFVAVAGIGAATDKGAYSTDGIIWTEMTMPASREWSALAWSGTVLVAVAGGATATDKCASSVNGISWTERTMFTSATWSGVAWNGARFCAVTTSAGGGVTNVCNTSSDGITWASQTLPANRAWTSIVWTGTYFVAVAGIGTATDKGAYSTDGLTATWTEMTMPASREWSTLAWNGSTLVALAIGSANGAYSSAGITWTENTLPTSADRYGIYGADGIFLAVVNNTDDANISYDGIVWPTRSLTLHERFQDSDVNGAATCRVGLYCGQQASAHPAFYAADNFLSPVHKGTVNTAHYLRAHAPNYLDDGGFESGAFSPYWTAEATNPWVIESTTELEGSYSASWDLVATKYLRQTSTKRLKKGKAYRLVFKAGSVTANPTAGAITINLFQSTSGTALDSDASGTTPTITTTAAWFSIDFTPDFETNDWYLNIAGDHTKANGATEITVDEFYLYDKLEISNLILGRHNLVGKGSVVVRSYKMSPLRSTVAAADYTDLDTLTVTTSDTHREALTSSYDPVVELQIPATAAFTPQAGEIYIGDQWQLPRHIKAPFDPWRTNRDGLREVTLKSEYVAPAFRTSHLEPLFDRLRDCEAIWYKWDTDNPFPVYSPRGDREAPFSPYTVSFELNLIEVI